MATIATEVIDSKRDERGRKITPRAEREAFVRSYEASGLTQKAFARRERIKFTTFVSWVQDFRRRAPSAKVGFTELVMARPGAALEVQLPNGIVIRGSKAEEVAQLLRLVQC